MYIAHSHCHMSCIRGQLPYISHSTRKIWICTPHTHLHFSSDSFHLPFTSFCTFFLQLTHNQSNKKSKKLHHTLNNLKLTMCSFQSYWRNILEHIFHTIFPLIINNFYIRWYFWVGISFIQLVCSHLSIIHKFLLHPHRCNCWAF